MCVFLTMCLSSYLSGVYFHAVQASGTGVLITLLVHMHVSVRRMAVVAGLVFCTHELWLSV